MSPIWIAAWALCALPQPVPAAIICWTDEHGGKVCGDHTPPEYAKKKREVYNANGVLVDTLPGELSDADRAAQQAKEREQQSAQDRADHDRFLLDTYRTTADLEAERDSRLRDLDFRIHVAEEAVTSGQATLEELRERADTTREAGGTPDATLLDQIHSYELSQSDTMNAVAQLKDRRGAMASQYDRDIRRYNELRAGSGSP
jgi:hypothetical protein